MDESVKQLWDAFLASGSAGDVSATTTYDAWHFGTGGAMADELVELVLAGRKRATAGALWSYEHDGDRVPREGDYSVVTDGSGRARCVIRTTAVEVVPFIDVDAAFAAAEGEGDLSLDYWRDGHWCYFSRELAESGRTPELDMPIVCERFEVAFTAEG